MSTCQDLLVARDWLRGAGVTLIGVLLVALVVLAVRELVLLRAEELRGRRKLVLLAAMFHFSGRRNAAEEAHAADGHAAAWETCEVPVCAEERKILASVDRELNDALARVSPRLEDPPGA